MAAPSFADIGDEATLGGRDSSGNYRWRVDSSGNLIPGDDNTYNLGSSTYTVKNVYLDGILDLTAAGYKPPIEIFTTGDTLTAAESGKICALSNSFTLAGFTLPAAAEGLTYTVTSGSGTASSYFRVMPNSASDTIRYSTCAGGSHIKSAGASADSVTLVGYPGSWYVTEMKGTFTVDN
jgi:hypothetical protein